MLKDIFGFDEHQEKATYGLGYNLIITRSSDNAVLNKGNTIDNAKIKSNSIYWYVPHYTPSLEQQKNNESDCKEEGYRALLSRKICFHETSKYSKFVGF